MFINLSAYKRASFHLRDLGVKVDRALFESMSSCSVNFCEIQCSLLIVVGPRN